MADPVLDENLILEALQRVPSYSNIGALQQGALQSLIDMYDRKMTREQFLHNAATAVSLYGQTCKLWMLGQMREAFDNGDLDIARIMQAEGALVAIMRKQTSELTEIVEQLKQCPTSQDAVH